LLALNVSSGHFAAAIVGVLPHAEFLGSGTIMRLHYKFAMKNPLYSSESSQDVLK
jgi:hypothetical protein